MVNSAAAIIWCLLPDVDTEEELVHRLVQDYAVDPTSIAEVVDHVLTEFAAQGLFVGTSSSVELHPQVHRLPAGDHKLPPSLSILPNIHIFSLASQNFKIVYQDKGIGACLAELFGHLEDVELVGVFTEILVIAKPAGGHDLYLAGKRRAADLQTNQVMPWISALVFEECCKALNEYQLIHAGVVVRDNKAILLPGCSGSGKSTLVAALAAKGWRYLSDELALIDVGGTVVWPFPQAMSIKAGSVSILDGYYPGLEALTEHRRIDGRAVRFVAPPIEKQLMDDAGPFEIAALFFPIYLPQVKVECLQLLPLEALQRLAAVGSSPRSLTDEDIEGLIYLADTLPCYLLYFDDLERAMEMIGERTG